MDRLDFWIFAAGIVLGWIGVRFDTRTPDDVKCLAPSRAMGLGNLLDTIDTGRKWREHKRHFPKSRVRNRAKAMFIPALFLAWVGIALFGVGI